MSLLLAAAASAAINSAPIVKAPPITLDSDILVCAHKADMMTLADLLNRGELQEANRVILTMPKCGYVLSGNRLTVVKREDGFQEIRLIFGTDQQDTATLWTDELK